MQPKHKSVETKHREEHQAFYDDLKGLDRRGFLKVSAAAFGIVAAKGLVPPTSFQPVSLAYGATSSGESQSFRFAYISDSHLYEKDVNDRFIRSLMRAVDDVNNLDPQPDFVFYGGDLAQLGQPKELDLGAEVLRNLKAPLKIMVGEHDWYLDLGEKWQALFGKPTESWDHKGVHFVKLLSVVEEE
jgi:predicted MPP superfamily phosphohydrolase